MNDNLSSKFNQDNSQEAVNYLNVSHIPHLTSSEIAQLWTSYMEHTMLRCIWKYFLATTNSTPLTELETETLNIIEKRIGIISDFFKKEDYPLPAGFSDNDVNLDAPPLFSETFLLHFINAEFNTSLNFNSFNIGLSTRPDVRDFYSACVESTLRLNINVTNLMLSEGILPKPPTIPVSSGIEFVSDPRFLSGFIGDKRPLLAVELAYLFNNAVGNDIGRILLTGFKQIAPSPEVQDFMKKGIQLCSDFIDTLSGKAMKDQIKLALIRDSGLTTSTIAPFSEKLMMFQVTILNTKAISEYGVSIASSLRHDLAKTYAQMMIEAAQFSELGAKIMMQKGWLEEPPQVRNQDRLAKHKH